MEGTQPNTLSKQTVDAVMRSVERLEGAASILAMLEEKADRQRIAPSEIAAVRCVVESCAEELDGAWPRPDVCDVSFRCRGVCSTDTLLGTDVAPPNRFLVKTFWEAASAAATKRRQRSIEPRAEPINCFRILEKLTAQ